MSKLDHFEFWSRYSEGKVKINIGTANGKPLNGYLATPANGGKGILVLPSWWGLKPFFEHVCDKLAVEGYTALAPDYYNGRVGNTIEETQILQQEAEGDQEAMWAVIKAGKDYLTSLRTGEPIGIIGFSMGTDWSLVAATKEPDIAALVLFYGCFNLDFSKMRSKVLGHFAEADEWVPLDQVRDVEQNMKAAGVDVNFYYYPRVAHWFVESDRPEYDPAAANLAWKRTFDFLSQTF